MLKVRLILLLSQVMVTVFRGGVTLTVFRSCIKHGRSFSLSGERQNLGNSG
jgi:hypothetical protein